MAVAADASTTAKAIAERRREEITRIASDARLSGRRESKQRAICDLLRRGTSRKAAAAACGVTFQGLYYWLQTDPNFKADVDAAEAEIETEMASCIAAAAPTDWRAAESWLKRRRREEWGDSLDIQAIMGQAQSLRDDQLVRQLYGEGAVIEAEATVEDLPALGEGCDE